MVLALRPKSLTRFKLFPFRSEAVDEKPALPGVVASRGGSARPPEHIWETDNTRTLAQRTSLEHMDEREYAPLLGLGRGVYTLKTCP